MRISTADRAAAIMILPMTAFCSALANQRFPAVKSIYRIWAKDDHSELAFEPAGRTIAAAGFVFCTTQPQHTRGAPRTISHTVPSDRARGEKITACGASWSARWGGRWRCGWAAWRSHLPPGTSCRPERRPARAIARSQCTCRRRRGPAHIAGSWQSRRHRDRFRWCTTMARAAPGRLARARPAPPRRRAHRWRSVQATSLKFCFCTYPISVSARRVFVSREALKLWSGGAAANSKVQCKRTKTWLQLVATARCDGWI